VSRPAAQAALAARSGISLDMLRKLEREQVPSPSFFTVARLARQLGLRLEKLAADAEQAGEDAEEGGANSQTGRSRRESSV
jgi:transcriptional regulator with XRE-family HTH domain